MLHHLLKQPEPPKRVVVIGAGGFVGGALCRRLAAADIAFLPLTRAEIDLSASDAAEKLKARLAPGDAVVAASAKAPCRTLGMLIDNLRMTEALVTAISASAVSHVVNISSDAVYADGPLPLTEASPTAPGSYHGAMHLAREITFGTEIKAAVAIVRPTLLYGRDDPHNGYGPNRFSRLAARGEEIVLFGAGEERRDHVLIDDLAELLFRILVHRSTGILNAATGDVHSFRSIAEGIVAASGRTVAIKDTARSGPMPHGGYRPFDIAATRDAFPDFTYVPLKIGIGRLAGKEDATPNG